MIAPEPLADVRQTKRDVAIRLVLGAQLGFVGVLTLDIRVDVRASSAADELVGQTVEGRREDRTGARILRVLAVVRVGGVVDLGLAREVAIGEVKRDILVELPERGEDLAFKPRPVQS